MNEQIPSEKVLGADGRIHGGFSRHEAEDATKCAGKSHHWRVVECCGLAGDDRDIEECARCGKQINVSCSFDEEYS